MQASLEVIFSEVMEHMVELMTDPFGNYLCQKLLDCCTREQRAIIVQVWGWRASRVRPTLTLVFVVRSFAMLTDC